MATNQETSQPTLAKGTLGTTSIAFFVVAAAAPLFVMAGVAPLVIGFGGVGAPSAYLIAGAALAIFAVGFTAMTRYIHNAGAFYAYIARGLGSTAGIITAVVALVSYNVLEIGMFGALGQFTAGTVGKLTGLDVAWWVWALIGVAIVWFLGSRSIHVGSQFLIALLCAETGILVLLAGAVLIKGGATGLEASSFAPSNVATPSLGAMLTFAFAAFMGFESTALYREEARKPDRTIPRATYIAVAFLGLFYAFMVWIGIEAFGPDKAQQAANSDPAGMFFAAMETYVGSWASTLMEILIITSILASLLAFHNAITRYAYSLSRESILPRVFGELHPRHLSPFKTSGMQSLLAAAVVIVFALFRLDPLTQLMIWVNSPGVFGVVGMQVVVAVAVIAFFWRNRRGHSVFRVVVAPAVAAVVLLGALGLMTKNIALLTGVTPTFAPVNIAILAVMPITVVVGYLIAIRIRRTKPEIYAVVGQRDAE
ncbi:APC family permease [Gordonia sp. TBRC 11910]|uniref:APC family permease n=1 Tax=Gordonia asplenii TaxID=2725283 RepID=A0A848L2C3_9ACTN|nr:APC family permease [Gordonia asplenii]NMO02681.1 APC family permease [Gordonia asplenii]